MKICVILWLAKHLPIFIATTRNIISMEKPKPFVFINAAMSADGKIDTFERKGAAISSRRVTGRAMPRTA